MNPFNTLLVWAWDSLKINHLNLKQVFEINALQPPLFLCSLSKFWKIFNLEKSISSDASVHNGLYVGFTLAQ